MSIDPITGALILRGAQTAAQFFAGLGEGKKRRPVKGIPSSITRGTERFKRLAEATRRPGRDYAESKIRQGTSTAIGRLERSTSNPSEILQGVSAAQTQENQAMQEQSAMDEQYRQQAELNYADQLNRQGAYEEQNFYYNQAQPYEENRARREALFGAGFANLDTLGQDIAAYQLLGGFGNKKGGKKRAVIPQNNQRYLNTNIKYPYFAGKTGNMPGSN